MLNAGKKVAILVGAGARGAADTIVEVADALGAGVAKALLGKDVLPDDLPFVTGAIGLLGTKPSIVHGRKATRLKVGSPPNAWRDGLHQGIAPNALLIGAVLLFIAIAGFWRAADQAKDYSRRKCAITLLVSLPIAVLSGWLLWFGNSVRPNGNGSNGFGPNWTCLSFGRAGALVCGRNDRSPAKRP